MWNCCSSTPDRTIPSHSASLLGSLSRCRCHMRNNLKDGFETALDVLRRTTPGSGRSQGGQQGGVNGHSKMAQPRLRHAQIWGCDQLRASSPADAGRPASGVRLRETASDPGLITVINNVIVHRQSKDARNDQRRPRTAAGGLRLETGRDRSLQLTLLCKSRQGWTSPFPGRTHPMASVTGMPRAVKRFRTATLTWSSATCRSKSRAMRR